MDFVTGLGGYIDAGMRILEEFAANKEMRALAIDLSVQDVCMKTFKARSNVAGREEAIAQAEESIERCFEEWGQVLTEVNQGSAWARRQAPFMVMLAKRCLTNYSDQDSETASKARQFLDDGDEEIRTWAKHYLEGYQAQKDSLSPAYPARIEQFTMLAAAMQAPGEH